MAKEVVYGIVPCRKCGVMTRSGRTPAKDAPGTRERVAGCLCRECGKKPDARVKPGGPTAEMIARRDAATVAALDSFIRARNARIEKFMKTARA